MSLPAPSPSFVSTSGQPDNHSNPITSCSYSSTSIWQLLYHIGYAGMSHSITVWRSRGTNPITCPETPPSIPQYGPIALLRMSHYTGLGPWMPLYMVYYNDFTDTWICLQESDPPSEPIIYSLRAMASAFFLTHHQLHPYIQRRFPPQLTKTHQRV